MFCSACGTEGQGRFCHTCGAELTGAAGSIRICSENANELLEERNKEKEKARGSIMTSATMISAIVMVAPYLIALLEGKKLSRVEGPPLWMVLTALAIFTAALIFVIVQAKKTREEYQKYKQYCLSETLVAEEKQIYGSTATEAFSLSYDQIASVEYTPELSAGTGAAIRLNGVLTITEVASGGWIQAKRHTFYSFKNGKELQAIINRQLHKG